MNKVFSSIVFCLCLCFSLKAQVVIINDNVLTQRLSEIKASVVDSLTNEPVAFASVYVVPSKDTVITNFTLTDATGKATLEDLYEYAKKAGEPVAASGKQELCETFLNLYAK